MAGKQLIQLLLMFVSPVLVACDCNQVTYLANHLEVNYDVLDNVGINPGFASRLEFKNAGEEDISSGSGDWSIYMFNIRLVLYCTLKPPTEIIPIPEGVPFNDSGLQLFHVQSTLFKLVPLAEFKGITAGQSLTVVFESSDWQAVVTDSMPNWYVASDTCDTAKTILSTAGESLSWVGPFDSSNQWKRNGNDKYDPYEPQERYDSYRIEDLHQAPLGVIPTPVHQELDPEQRLTLQGWVIAEVGAENEAKYLADKLHTQVVSPAPSSRVIHVNVGEAEEHEDCVDNPEAYKVQIMTDEEIIHITSKTKHGAFYGVQTLLSLAADSSGVPHGTIQDCPRYPWRGMFADVSRNFHDKAAILKLLDAMATYKLNKFHFHLCDDEGWRLEIPGLEELTQVGSKRCHDPSGDQCLIPQLGSGATVGTAGSGYYTEEDYREILQYAQDRHIEVIPEFDMPGHSHAAINAMLARYKKYENDDLPKAEEYLLNDLNDTSEYFSIQMYTDNSVNPCIESTYRFVEKVMNETINLHADIQPLEIFHFGGDEVPHTAWLDSPACLKLQESRPDLNYTRALKGHFVMRTGVIAQQLGLKLAGWEDGFTDEGDVPFNISNFGEEVYSHAWNNIWDWGAGKHAYEQANAGYKVILSHATHLYFDHPSEASPYERGYYWATRYSDVFKAFSYIPDDVYNNMDEDVGLMGDELDREQICENYGCPELEEKDNIVGIQGQIWTETVRTTSQFEEMIFPRLLALAERAWHKADWEWIEDVEERKEKRMEDWIKFAHALGYRELARLENLNIQYHIRPPGFMTPDSDLRLRGNTEFPGQRIQLSSDGGDTWMDYTSDLEATQESVYTVRASTNDRRYYSRSYQLTYPKVSSGEVMKPTLLTLSLTFLLVMYNH